MPTFRNRLLFKIYGLLMPGESLRWVPARRWLLDRMLGRKHVGLDVRANVSITGWWALELGDRVTINRNCTLLADGGLKIGDDTMIAPDCSIVTTEHGMAFGVPMRDQPVIHRSVSIGRDVWIGTRAIVLSGSQIPEGTIIGAGSVVKGKFAEPAMVIAGVPAKVIKAR